MSEDKKRLTKYQYWNDSTSVSYLMTCCQDWFGLVLEYETARTIHKQLGVYPAPERDEAIEDVLFIYFGKQK